VQLQGVSSRRAHHLKKNYSIWKEEEVLGPKAYWVFIVWPRAPFLAYCGRGFSVICFIWILARVGEKEGALQKEDPSIRGIRSSPISLKLCQGVCLAPIYSF
jgi:hypothetical protein